jgi:hypothetical protein
MTVDGLFSRSCGDQSICMTRSEFNIAPFVNVENMMELVVMIGVVWFLNELAAYLEEDGSLCER